MNIELNKKTDAVCFFMVALLWLVFLKAGFSAYFDSTNPFPEFHSWLPVILAGRTLLFASAIVGFIQNWRNKKAYTFSVYAILASMVQSTFSCFESPQSIEFYQYISFFYLASASTYRSNSKNFFAFYLPIIIIGSGAPLLFKDFSTVSDLASFLYIYTTPISLSVIALTIFYHRTKHNNLIRENEKLNKDLIEEQEKLIHQEIVLRRRIQTELEETIVKLKEEEKLSELARITQMIAHDIRRPFSSIKMFLKLFSDPINQPNAQEMKTLTTELEEQISSAEILVDDILETSRSGSFKKDDHNIEEVCRTNLTLACKAIPANKRIQIDENYQTNGMVLINLDKMNRVLINIIGNAIEATPTSGRIWVETALVDSKDQDANVQIRIGNTGSYIEPENREKIFNSFFTTGKENGTGLGLAIAKKIITDHGGAITCQSDPITGTEFVFYLPLSKSN